MTVHQTAHIWWTLWQLCGTFSAWQSLRGNQVNGNELDEADYRFLASPERTCRLSLFFIRTSACIIQPIAILQLLSSCQEDRKEQTINSRQGSIGRNQNAHCVGGGYQMTHSRTSPPQSRDLSIWPEPGKKNDKTLDTARANRLSTSLAQLHLSVVLTGHSMWLDFRMAI